MNFDLKLSKDVLDAIQRNKKIEAIKLLCDQTGMGLKDAKRTIERHIDEQANEEYMQGNISDSQNKMFQPEPSIDPLTLILLSLAAIYAVYYFFVQ